MRSYRAGPLAGGVILVPAGVDRPSSAAEELLRSGISLVFAGRWPEGLPVDGVGADYARAAELATEHLVGLGHQRIAYVKGLPHSPASRRMTAIAGPSPARDCRTMLRSRASSTFLPSKRGLLRSRRSATSRCRSRPLSPATT